MSYIYLTIRTGDLWEDAHHWTNQVKKPHVVFQKIVVLFIYQIVTLIVQVATDIINTGASSVQIIDPALLVASAPPFQSQTGLIITMV